MDKVTLLLDCDGVMADYVGRVLQDARTLYGKEIDPGDIHEWDVYADVARIAGKPYAQVKEDMIGMLHQPGWCAGIRPLPGAVDGVRSLRAMRPHVDVHVVTAPWHSSPYWFNERLEWLKVHFGVQAKDVTFTHRKQDVSGPRSGLTVFVDDKPQAVREWVEDNVAVDENDRTLGLLFVTPRAGHMARAALEHVHGWTDLAVRIVRFEAR